jgi:hypothetical protein
MNVKEILEKFDINEDDVFNIYPYGSRVYGTSNENSDYDWIIVYKQALLPNGAFKNNAISNLDRTHQAVCYSRSGFQDAINNYEIAALECLSLPDNLILKKQWPFQIRKWEEKEFVKKVVSKISNSWYVAINQKKNGEKEIPKKGIFHALRILIFANQLKKHNKIINFSAANELYDQIMNDDNFHIHDWMELKEKLISQLKEE